MNINPALFNQMMSACLESIMNGNASQAQGGVPNILAQSNPHTQHQFTQNNLHSQHSPGMQNFNRHGIHRPKNTQGIKHHAHPNLF